MTWTSFHRRGEVLREVVVAADSRRDGVLPSDVPGVSEAFTDSTELLGALSLKWHTRLAGRIERELLHEPMDLRAAVVSAWQHAATELPGVRAVLDRQREQPDSYAIAVMMSKSTAKEHELLAVMAGAASVHDHRAAVVGAAIEAEARTGLVRPPRSEPTSTSLLGRLRAALAA